MGARFVVDKQNQLQQLNITGRPHYPAFVVLAAKIVSIIFHPLFIPVYLVYFLTRIHPYLFSGIDNWAKTRSLLQVFVNCTFLPVVSMLLLKGLKFIDSIYLKTQRDRIIPYVICMIFYFWNWYVFKNNLADKEIVVLSLAIFIASIFGFMANIYIKVSMHAIATGLMMTFLAYLVFGDSMNLILYLCAAVFITGLVCTSRLIVSDHCAKEIYAGIFFGVASLLLAIIFA